MDFQLSEDQSALLSALQAILDDHADIPQAERHGYVRFDRRLQDTLEANGFLDAARELGAIEGALVIFETAKLPSMVETVGRGLVAPLVCPDLQPGGPVALAERAQLGKAIRNLPIASHLIVADDDDAVVIDVQGLAIEPVPSILGFPYGRFAVPADLAQGRRYPGAAAELRRLWRVGIVAEIAGAARGAIDFTTDYVKNRRLFGRAIGSYQSVQHRLVMRHGHALSTYYLAMRAAWSATQSDAAIAACYAQSGIGELMFDLHQFNGGMGMTNEHLLHFWLYRIRALQAEVGGPAGAGLDVSALRWDRPVEMPA